MVKKLLLEIIDFYRDKLVNDNCTDADMQSAFALLSENVSSEATISDIAKHFGQSESNVRNVLSRKYVGKPKRRVSYDFMKIVRNIPASWTH